MKIPLDWKSYFKYFMTMTSLDDVAIEKIDYMPENINPINIHNIIMVSDYIFITEVHMFI